LEILLSNKDEDLFIESGISTGTSLDTNLVMKALQLIRSNYNIPPLEVRLLKKIPFGAGIGGGSADASFMLKLLNLKFELGITANDLAKMASQLGADCPFFIHNKPLFASGIGDLFDEVELSLNQYHWVLVNPNIHVSTKEAFSLITPHTPAISLKEIVKEPIDSWKLTMVNDFEKSIFSLYPAVADIKDKLYALGAIYASMSGSGPSVYAIFDHKTNIKEHFPHYYVWEQA
jgi:4-diphosphocytidyl-2-C-methyl-D-erythritol kinase